MGDAETERFRTTIRGPDDWRAEIQAVVDRFGLSWNQALLITSTIGRRILTELELREDQLQRLRTSGPRTTTTIRGSHSWQEALQTLADQMGETWTDALVVTSRVGWRVLERVTVTQDQLDGLLG